MDTTASAETRATGAPSQGESLISFEGVHKSFGSRVVLDGLNLAIGRGEALVLMGPSGTGKSVTLRHVVGLVRADAGRVLVDGHDMASISKSELSELRRRMGYLFQEGALINWLSVGANVALPLRENTKMDADEVRGRVEEKLSMVGLEDIWDQMPQELSGGMRKRVGLARALVNEPEIILYDEPNAGLDPEISTSINHLMRDLQDRLPITSIIITHLVSCVRMVADRVVLLADGQLVADAPPREFLASDHPRVQSFLGKDPD